MDIGSSATLRCCVSDKVVGILVWFKQPNRKKPQSMVTVYKSSEESFYSNSQNPRFRIETYGNCFKTTILKIIWSDEAMYYCARKSPSTVFKYGTSLKITGRIYQWWDFFFPCFVCYWGGGILTNCVHCEFQTLSQWITKMFILLILKYSCHCIRTL